MTIDIYTVSKLLSRQQVVSIGLFNDPRTKKKSKYLQLFEAIIDRRVNNDQEAFEKLHYENMASFKKFRNRYQKKILDILLWTEAREAATDRYNEKYMKLLKLYQAARVLHIRNEKKNAVIIYNYVKNQAQKEEILELELQCLLQLKSHYSFVEPNKAKLSVIKNEYKACKKAFGKMMALNEHYDELSYKNITLPSNKLEEHKRSTLKTSVDLLKSIEPTDQYNYIYKTLEITSYAYNINDNLEKAIETSQRAIQLSKERYTSMHRNIVTASMDILSSYLKLKDYDQSKKYLSEILLHEKKFAFGLIKLKGLEFSIAAVTKDYDHLQELTTFILSNKKINDNLVQKEEWLIRDAYVNLLLEANVITNAGVDQSNRKFKLSRFINDIQFYSKDKRGTNISVLIVELLFYLLRKQYDKIIDKLDALNQYTYRYLRNDETLRSNCFIKMLLKLPEAEYNPMRTSRYVTKYKTKLMQTPFEISLKPVTEEIIPFDYLWEIVIDILNKNQRNKLK